MSTTRFVVLCALVLCYASIPTLGYGNWDEDRDASTLEVHESWTEEPMAPIDAPLTAPATPPSVSPSAAPATPPAVSPSAAPATPPKTPPATAPATPPATPPKTPPATAPATVPATVIPPPPLAPNQAPTVVAEPPLPPASPDCTLRFLTTFDWTSISPTEGVVHFDIRNDLRVDWRTACELTNPTFTWTITGFPGVTTLHTSSVTFAKEQLQALFTGADKDTPVKEISIKLVIAATGKNGQPVNPNPVTLHARLYQPPERLAGAEFVTAPTTSVPFLNELPLTFHKSAIKFGSFYSVSYAYSADAAATKYGFGTFRGTWAITDPDQEVKLQVPITEDQQKKLVAGQAVPSVTLWCYLYVQNDHFVGSNFGPFTVTIAGRAAVTDEAEKQKIAEDILNDKFSKDPFEAVQYYLGAVGSVLSPEKQAEFLEKAYEALDTVVSDTNVAPAAPSSIDGAIEQIAEIRAKKIADMPPAMQLQLVDSFRQLIKSDKSLVALDSASSSGSSNSGDLVSVESVQRALQVGEMLLAASIAVGTSGLTEAMKNTLTAAVGLVLRLLTSFAQNHGGALPPSAPTKSGSSGNTNKLKEFASNGAKFSNLANGRKFVSQAALASSIRLAMNSLENVAKAGVTVDSVTKTTSSCTGAETLNNCYFFSEAYIVDPGKYNELENLFDGIVKMGSLTNQLTTLGYGTIIVLYTAINDQNLFDAQFDPSIGVNPVRQFGGNARLEFFLPKVASARLQAGERLPIQLPEGSTAPQLVIPGLTQAMLPQNPITVRRSFTDQQWVKTSGSSVVPLTSTVVAGAGYRIIDYFWTVAAQPPPPAVGAPSVPTSVPSVRPGQPVQPLAPLAPNTRANVDKSSNDSNGTAIGVGVGVGVGACVLISLILVALWVRRKNANDDNYTDPEFAVGKQAVWTVDPLMGDAEAGHFAPPPTPLSATYVEQVVQGADYGATVSRV